LEYDQDLITGFKEKLHGEEGWINGGFYVLQREAIDYIAGDETIWEREPIERLTCESQLIGYRHDRCWSCMGTLREKTISKVSGNPARIR
jgi:glucose-1-phosphate cytidylyltransferase